MRLTEAVVLFSTMVGQAAASGPAMVSAASGTTPVAPGSIVSIYGENLSSGTTIAPTMPLPTSLGSVSVSISDSAGVSADLPLFYVSAMQINAMIPSSVATGTATFTVNTPSGAISGSVTVATLAPGLFSANETGKDVASAQFVVNAADGTQAITNIFQCGAGASNCVPLNLDVSGGTTALVLYGTGIRGAASVSSLSVTIGSQTLPVTFAGAVSGYAGLDQVNVMLPASLAGTGVANITLNVNGSVTSPLTASFGYATSAPACSGCTVYTNPPYTFNTPVAGACQVSSVTEQPAGALYPPNSWPYANNEVVYSQAAGSAETDQLYIAQIASDGTRTNPTCLSCSQTNPPIATFKNAASLRPQGDWIMVRVEDASGPVINQSSSIDLQVIRNNGYYSNLWMVNVSTNQWYQVTSFTAPPGGNPGAFGELVPRWSPDGTKVMFSETYKAPDPANLQGYWHFYLADFTVDSTSGTPSLTNVTDISLPGDVFYEPQDWSPDGSTVVVQSYTPGINAYGVDLYAVNVVPGPGFGSYTDLTNSPFSWDEHAVYSPDGQEIAYSSSLSFANIIPQYGTLPWSQFRDYLHNEMFLMSSNGTNVEQLTYFNTASSTEFAPQFADVIFETWDIAGNELMVVNGTPEVPVPGGNSVWLVNFSGDCGGQAQ